MSCDFGGWVIERTASTWLPPSCITCSGGSQPPCGEDAKEPCGESGLERKLLARCNSEHLGNESCRECSPPGRVLQLRPQAS